MLDNYSEDSEAVARLRREPLGVYLDSLAASRIRAGYARSTVRTHLWAIADFGRWLAQERLTVADIDERVVDAFLDQRQRQGRRHRSHRAAVHHVLDHLREEGVVRCPQLLRVDAPVDQFLGRYNGYLRVERGLAEATVAGYRPFVRSFLVERFGDEPLRLRELVPADVSRFLLRHAQSLTPASARLMTTALRSLFRFLLQHGEIEVDLAASVLSVASRRSSTLPKYLEPEEVEHLLGTCDRTTGTGRRNYAILLFLARLGLRAGEVVALELDDIDWRAGEIMVRGKGLRRERLPLPSDVGAALAAYLHRDRPSCATRRVFVRVRAPLRDLGGPSTVSTIVRRALARADLHPPQRGAHLLRHSLATRMLLQGASMAEIGQLLRHRSANTTELYAKVDFERLRSLAKSWPGTGGER
ncbi:tyrosine-type recombinase/integrase [Planctomycetota bacterium]